MKALCTSSGLSSLQQGRKVSSVADREGNREECINLDSHDPLIYA